MAMETEEQPILTTNSIASNEDTLKSNAQSLCGESNEGNEGNEQNEQNQINLFWRNLTYRIKLFEYKCVNGIPYKFVKRKKTLIQDLCGNFVSGRLTAILGPNGAGKSTLLNCLAGKRKEGLTGQINVTFNGSKREVKFAYYCQNDVLLDSLTVEESLLYASQLKYCCKKKRIDDLLASGAVKSNGFVSVPNKLHSSRCFHRLKVEKLVNDLHLSKCAKTPVVHCSGGQKRRLSIALELIFGPSILLLDEPTSGLDSLSTLQCIQLLKQLTLNTDNQMIIAVVIHQPTARLLSYFDDLYVMSSTGQCIYEGSAANMIDKFSSFDLNCPQFYNPSDFAIEIGSGDYGMDVIEVLAEEHSLSYKKYVIKKSKSIEVSQVIQKTQKHSFDEQILNTWPLTKRCFLMNVKNPKQYLLQAVSVALMLILMFVLHLDNKIGTFDACFQRPSIPYFRKLHIFDILNPETSPFPNWAYIFYSNLFIVFVSMLPTLLTFPLEIAVFTKEYSNGWYSLSSYFMAKTIADMPQNFVFPVIYCIGSYMITDQIMEWWRLMGFVAILVLLSILAQGLGFLISALFVDSITAATVIGALVNVPLLLFTGLLIKIQMIPSFFQPFTFISYFRVAFESIMTLIYGFGRCDPINDVTINNMKSEFGDQIVPMFKCIYDYDYEMVENLTMALDFFNGLIDQNYSFALQAFEFSETNLLINIIILIVYGIILRILAYFLLVWKTKVK